MSLGDWAEVARDVGLTLHHVVPENVTGATFQSLRREMAQARRPSPSKHTAPWLTGTRRDVNVIVRPIVLHYVGTTRPKEPTSTSAVAEIDPPLFAGLRLVTPDLTPFFGMPTFVEPTQHPAVDATFMATAFDGVRVRELLLPGGDPDRLGEQLALAGRTCSVVVKDSTVEAIALGAAPSRERVDGLVELATSLARDVSERARTLRQTPLEIAAREAWQRVAASLGLSFDPLRWHVFGGLGGVEVSVMLDGSPPAVSTTFRARLRTPLPVVLLLRRDFREHGAGPGYPELDKLFALQAHDLPSARALFGDPELRRRIAEEAETSNVVLDDRELMIGRGGFASPREIAQRLEALVAIVDRLTPPVRAAGPFR